MKEQEHMDDLEKLIREDYECRAEAEMQEIASDDSLAMPEGVKASVRDKIDAQIREKKAKEAYSKLSEEDRLALELGRKLMLEGKNIAAQDTDDNGNTSKKAVVCRKRFRLKGCIVLAASIALVLAIGVTSMGGPNKIVKRIKSAVIEREVEKINSSDENMIITEENEEEAYQIISDEFGIEPVRIVEYPEEMFFEYLDFDKNMQMAEMSYNYNGETVVYIISTTYLDSSWGIDVEDKVTDQYIIQKSEVNIEIKEYETAETSTLRYSGRFVYKGLEYYLMGTMNKSEFEKIVNNLYFVGEKASVFE